MASPPNKTLNSRISITQALPFGNGSTGTVYVGTSLHPQTHPVAIKAIPLKQVLVNEVTAYLLQCELQALKKTSLMKNGSIVKLEEIIVKDEYCYIVMELLQGGTLKDYISRKKKLNEEEALRILHHLLAGYKILKDNGIVHRDIKPENIMFQTNPEKAFILPKIIDFGYCKMEAIQPKPKLFYNVGSPRYMSPEAYLDNLYTQKSDIWSFGIVFYEMVTGTTFDKGKNIIQTFNFIRDRGIPIPLNLSNTTKSILQQMLKLNPIKRLSCEELLQNISKTTIDQRQVHLAVSMSEKNLSDVNFRAKKAANFYPHKTEIKKEDHQKVLKDSVKIQTSSHQFGKVSMKIPITFHNKTMNTCASDRKIQIQNSIANNIPSKPADKPLSVTQNKITKNFSQNIQPVEATRTARIVTLPHSINPPPNLHSSERFTKVDNSKPPLITPKVQSNQNLNFSQKIFPKTIYSEIKAQENRGWEKANIAKTPLVGFTPTVFINQRPATKQVISMERKN